MTDRELIELAAKAAGVEISTWSNCQPGGFLKGGAGKFWNPLTDDADALRLAVKLGLGVTPYPIFAKPKHSVIAKLYQSHLDLDRGLSTAIEIIELYNNDTYAATRRAIVRAAAAIGGAA